LNIRFTVYSHNVASKLGTVIAGSPEEALREAKRKFMAPVIGDAPTSSGISILLWKKFHNERQESKCRDSL
jgi:hypothetical protein